MGKGGWEGGCTEEKNKSKEARQKGNENLDLSFSLGMTISKEGELLDVSPGSPAYAAGVGAGMKLLGVSGRKYSKDVIRTALRRSATSQQPIALLAENGE